MNIVQSLRLHNVIAGGVKTQHFGNERRRMLSIAIHRDHDVGCRPIEARAERGLVAEVAAQMNDHHSRIRSRDPIQQRRRLVRRAVIHVDVPARVFRGKFCLIEQRVKANQALLLVV